VDGAEAKRGDEDRIGANRATILGFRMFGLFQILADGLKMFVKGTSG
jgi:NADH:ubiquinone oxidoreductase subunit H